jgi:hypothetical protein
MPIVRNKALDRRQAEQGAVPRQSVGRLSDHEQNNTDDRTYLAETRIRILCSKLTIFPLRIAA